MITITFTSLDVINALSKMSEKEKKKFHSDVLKSQTEDTPIEININGKIIRFKRKK